MVKNNKYLQYIKPPPIKDLENEIWKPCVEDNMYLISNYSRVKNAKTGLLMKADACKKVDENNNTIISYSRYHLNGKHYMAHRLVASAFLGPIDVGLVVDHIDRTRTNHHVSNLRIVSQQRNSEYAMGKQVLQIDEKTNKIVKIWNSLVSATKYLKMAKGTLGQTIKRNNYEYKKDGYIWKYAPPIEEKKT